MRKVHSTKLVGSNFELELPLEVAEDLNYDTDASVTTLLSNMTNSGNSNPESHFPSEDFTSLTPEAKDLWRKLTPDRKAMILKGRRNINRSNNMSNSSEFNNFSYKTVKSPSCNRKPFVKAILHELLSEIIFEIN